MSKVIDEEGWEPITPAVAALARAAPRSAAPVAAEEGWEPVAPEVLAQLAPRPKASALEAGARGLTQGVTQGWSDEAAAWLGSKMPGLHREPWEIAGDLAEGKSLSEAFSGPRRGYEELRDELRTLNHQAREDQPVAYAGAEIGGDVLASAALPGSSKLAGRVLQNAVAGAGASEGKTAADVATDALATVAAAEALGAGAKLAGRGVSKVVQGLPGLAERSAVKAAGAIQSDLNKIGEDRVEPLGRKMLDAGLVPFAGSKGAVLERAKKLRAEGGKKVGDILDFMDEMTGKKFNWAQARRNMDSVISKLTPTQREAAAPMIDKMVRNLEANAVEGGGFAAANRMKTDLNDAINYAADPKLKTKLEKQLVRTLNEEIERQVGDVFGQGASQAAAKSGRLLGSSEAFAKEVGEDAAAQFRKAKSDFGLGEETAKLARKGVNRELGNRTPSLTDYIVGASALGGGYAADNLLGGGLSAAAFSMGNRLARQRGRAAVAVGADQLAKAIGAGSEMMSRNPQAAKLIEGLDLGGLSARELERIDPEVWRRLLERLEASP